MSPAAYYVLFSFIIITLLTIATFYKDGEGYCKFFVWLTMTLFVGLRVGVGRDYTTYLVSYTNELSPTFLDYEPLWQIIINSYRILNLPYHFWLICISGLTYYTFFRALKAWKINWVLGVLCYILIYKGFFESMNQMRQTLAMPFILWGMAHLYNKSYWKFILLILLGGCFHRSAYLCLFILPIVSISWKRSILTTGLLGTLLLGMFFFNDLVVFFKAIIPSTYQVYLEDTTIWKTDTSTGLYRIFLNLLGLGLIFLVYQKEDKQDKRLNFLLRMIIASVCIYNVCYYFEPAMRLMNYPFSSFFILLPIGLFHKEAFLIRLFSLTALLGLTIFTLKDISASKEPFAHYQTILNKTYPRKQIKPLRPDPEKDYNRSPKDYDRHKDNTERKR